MGNRLRRRRLLVGRIGRGLGDFDKGGTDEAIAHHITFPVADHDGTIGRSGDRLIGERLMAQRIKLLAGGLFHPDTPIGQGGGHVFERDFDAGPDLVQRASCRKRLIEGVERGKQVGEQRDDGIFGRSLLVTVDPTPVVIKLGAPPQELVLQRGHFLFEDRDLIVLDKPAGLVVHPAPGNLDGTLVNALLAHCGPSFTGIGAEMRPGIVHRLDKETSGVMVVAKTQLASDALTTAFAERDLDRSYLALCWGVPSPTSGEIQGAIGRDQRDRKRMAVVTHGGKPALTRYQVSKVWRMAVSLLECRLATGRTHQIRVHLQSIGTPLLIDPLYNPLSGPVYLSRLKRDYNPTRDEEKPLMSRLTLHAAKLRFVAPGGETVELDSPLPKDFRALLTQLAKLG